MATQREIFGAGHEGFPPLPLLMVIVNRNTCTSYCGFGAVIDGAATVAKASCLLTDWGTATQGRSGLSSPSFEYGDNGNKTRMRHKEKCAKCGSVFPAAAVG